MNPIAGKLNWKYQKLQFLLRPLLLRKAPEFVYRAAPRTLRNEIPVFTYHVAAPEQFEAHCKFLRDNDYRTVSADELVDLLTSKGPGSIEKSILLTFDDGLKSVWSVAFPLLRKYGLRATCFLIPGCIPDGSGEVRPTLEDVWNGRAEVDEVASLGQGPGALATWAEIRRMHDSGVVDFQSHTMYHSLVPTSPRVFDFVHPGYNPGFFGNLRIPIYTEGGRDALERKPLMGAPIYRSKPRLQADKRFFDDERIRRRCVGLVDDVGPDRFFSNRAWRRKLHSAVASQRRSGQVNERYETVKERDASILGELRASRVAIESRLPGARVGHLCLPWYDAGEFAVESAKRAGFRGAYFGHRPARSTNRPGDDPFHFVRLEDYYLLRLPGRGRMSLGGLFRQL